jgi:hypothetical protein
LTPRRSTSPRPKSPGVFADAERPSTTYYGSINCYAQRSDKLNGSYHRIRGDLPVARIWKSAITAQPGSPAAASGSSDHPVRACSDQKRGVRVFDASAAGQATVVLSCFGLKARERPPKLELPVAGRESSTRPSSAGTRADDSGGPAAPRPATTRCYSALVMTHRSSASWR